MRLVLKIRAGSDAGSELFVDPGARVRVGRRSPSEYTFPDDQGISRQHFAIECGRETCRIQDLNSSNGTWVNRQRVSEAELKEGDEIAAGDMVFVVHYDREQLASAPSKAASPQSFSQPQLTVDLLNPAASAAPSSKPDKPEEPELSLEEKLLKLLREDYQPLYAILDGARSPQIYKLLVEAKQEAQKAAAPPDAPPAPPAFQPPAMGMLEGGAQYESLFEGWAKPKMALFAPYLVSLPPWSKLLEKLVTKGWGKSWGVFLTCPWAFADLRQHLRQFLMVNMPDGKQVYFRYYDPRVLRVYLPTCTPQEVAYFFGPVMRFVIENEKPESLLEFIRREAGMFSNVVQLAPAEPEGEGPAAPPSTEKTQPPANIR